MSTSRRELSDAYEAQDLIIQAAQEAKRTATQDYRQFLDGRGMDKDAIKDEVEGFKKAYRRKMDSKKKGPEAVEHVDAIADEIFLEITAARAPRATRVENIEEFPAHDEDGVILEDEPQVAPQPVRTLAADTETLGGEQPIQPETANKSMAARMDVPGPLRMTPASDPQPDPQDRIGGVGNGPEAVALAAGTQAPPIDTPLYAEPGIITHEQNGPEPMVAHPYATCWPVNPVAVDVDNPVREPIVKIGGMILDGRGRYLASRAVHTSPNSTLEYPVVQYAGTDPLADCIRWNLASRTLGEKQLETVAAKLCKAAPDRADEIHELMGLAQVSEEAA